MGSTVVRQERIGARVPREVCDTLRHAAELTAFVAVLRHAPRVVCGYYALTLTEVTTGALAEIQRKRLPRVTVQA